jgi:hypothetical protein
MHEVNPSHRDNTVLPPYAQESRWLRRLGYEIWDHLWPWRRHGFQGRRFVLALSLGVAAVVSVVWLLAAAGRIGPTAVIGWWVGWSVFEVLVRWQSKPYVKEGPWWGKQYRRADLADMICYVAFKNLLIGAALFVAMRLLGVLDFLQGLPGLRWLYA